MIDTPPKITGTGANNIVKSKVNVRRVGGYDDLLNPEEIVVFFRPGVPVMDESGKFLNFENYGRTRLKCRKQQLSMSEETTCIASFNESNYHWIKNSYWWFNRTNVAAWPTQTTKASTKS